jgi:hypothetical protein
MKLDSLAKQYDRLTVEERFVLTVQAIGRADGAELDRLTAVAARKRVSTVDTYAHLESWLSVMFLSFLELVDRAAFLNESITCWRDQMRDEDLRWQQGATEKNNGEPLSTRLGPAVFAAGYLLKTRMAGWELWCKRRKLPALAFFQELPGYDRLQRALALTRESRDRAWGFAFSPNEMLNWLNTMRDQGRPELVELPCTAERYADEYEWRFQDRCRAHTGG